MLVTSAESMIELGRRLASQLRAGDLVILSGEMGAGKTTFVRGIGEFLGVETSSPTFVISRAHETNPKLVHSDLYRLLGERDLARQIEELDINFGEDAIHLIEWGEELTKDLDREFLLIRFAQGDSESDREVEFVANGKRWEQLAI